VEEHGFKHDEAEWEDVVGESAPQHRAVGVLTHSTSNASSMRFI
jgi:hypothetical protein